MSSPGAAAGSLPRGRPRWLRAERALPAAGVIIGGLLLVGPVVTNLIYAFSTGGSKGLRASFATMAGLFTSGRFAQATLNTLIAAVGATILACFFGLVLAWIVARTDTPLRAWLGTLNLVPFFMSPFVGAVAWIILAAPRAGLLNQLLHRLFGLPTDLLNIYGLVGVIWVLSLFYTPYVYLFVLGPLSSMDPSLEDAARTHGSGLWRTLRTITLPLVSPSLLSGALIVFVTSAGLFDIPIGLAAPHGIPMLPTVIYESLQWPADYNKAAAIGTLLMMVTIIGILLQRLYLARRNFTTVSGKGYRARRIELGRWRWAAMTFEAGYVGTAVALPVLALLLVSLSKLWTGWVVPRSFTLSNFSYVIFHYDLARRAMGNSMVLALLGATIGVAICTLQAYFITRGRSRWTGLADLIVALPLGIPGIVLGLGFLIMLIGTPLYGTLWIILLAYVTRFMAFVQRNVSGMMLSLGGELEESARTSGATWSQTFRMVMLPLLRPALVAAWLMLFVIYVRELSSSVLLYANGTETFTVAMLIISQHNLQYVAALAVIQTAILFIAITIVRQLTATETLSI